VTAQQPVAELHRQRAITALSDVDGDRVFGMPMERISTGEYLLLVIMVDDKYPSQATAAVLSVDPHARHRTRARLRGRSTPV
jgi:hypothetical protein